MKNKIIFNSCREMAEVLKNEMPFEGWINTAETIERRNDEQMKKFAGCTFKESLDMLECGDVKTAKKIHEAGDIRETSTAGAPVLRAAVVGCIPSIPNYLRGVPTNMLSVEKQSRKEKTIITLYLNTTISFSVNRTKAAEVARRILSVVQKVEKQGYQIQIYACMAGAKSLSNIEDSLLILTNIKTAGAPLNLINVAFSLANPAFFRCCCLGVMERRLKEVWSGHGWVRKIEDFKNEYNLKGLFINLQDAIFQNWNFDYISKKFNDYLEKGE